MRESIFNTLFCSAVEVIASPSPLPLLFDSAFKNTSACCESYTHLPHLWHIPRLTRKARSLDHFHVLLTFLKEAWRPEWGKKLIKVKKKKKRRYFASGGILLDLLVLWNKRKKEAERHFQGLFVRGHATSLMWVHKQQSEYKSWGVQVSLCAQNKQGVKLTTDRADSRTQLSVSSKAGIYVHS